MLQTKIGNLYETLTNSEKQIADFLVNNSQNVKTMTSYDLARAIGVGQATIIRFTKKVGYHSFRELLADIPIQDNQNLDLEEISVTETTEVTNKKVISRYYEILALTEALNDSQTFDQCIDLIVQAKSILCIGTGNSNDFAQYLAGQLITAGIPAKSFTNSHLVFSEILMMHQNDVAIFFSESGESREVVYAAQAAKQRQIPIIAITKATDNSLRRLADYTLNTVNYDVKSMLKTTTIRCSQLCLIDMLTLNLYKRDFNYYSQKSKEGRELLEKAFPKIK